MVYMSNVCIKLLNGVSQSKVARILSLCQSNIKCAHVEVVIVVTQMGIANRDIKLENTLLMDESERPLLKLCDFGYSKDEYQGSACKTICGESLFKAQIAERRHTLSCCLMCCFKHITPLPMNSHRC